MRNFLQIIFSYVSLARAENFADVNPLDFRNEPVKIAFADLAKVMI